MYQLDRFVALIRPREPFLDWLRSVPDFEDLEFTLEQVRGDSTALLIPQFDDDEEAVAFVYRIWEEVFMAELDAWTEEKALWPQGRTIEMFMEWFDVEIHTTVAEIEESDTQTH